MVPDFRLELPSSTPGLNLLPQESEQRLAELKFTCSKVHYKSGVKQRIFKRAVEHRAGEVVKEYQGKVEGGYGLTAGGGGGKREDEKKTGSIWRPDNYCSREV